MDTKQIALDRKEAAKLLSKSKSIILKKWETLCRDKVAAAQAQQRSALRDSLPKFLDRLVETLIHANPFSQAELNAEAAREHAEDRSNQEEYTLDEVIYEYHVLRTVIFDCLEAEYLFDLETRKMIHSFVDRGVRKCAVRYAELEVYSRKKSEANQKRLSFALEASNMGTWELDLQTNILTGSPQHAAILGIESTNEDIAEISERLVHPDDKLGIENAWKLSVESKLPFIHRYRIIRPSGEIRWVEVRGHTQQSEEAHILLGLLLDVSDEIKHQEAMLNLQADAVNNLEFMKATIVELEQERELRERFVAALTHDLRTPLTAAKMTSQLLRRKSNDPASVNSLAARIVANIDRTDGMIQDLLDANHIKAGAGIPIFVSACEMGAIFENTVSDLALAYGQRFTFEKTQPRLEGFWDATGVQRMIENLAGNAVKYGDEKSPITLKFQKNENQVELSVHNFGKPITVEDMQRLFEPYQRTDSALSGGHKGWGIGLTLVKGIVEAHGGSVKVRSSLYEGTTFSLILPIIADENGRHGCRKSEGL